MRKNFHPACKPNDSRSSRFGRSILALSAAAAVSAAPAAHAQVTASAAGAAQFLSLGASAAYAFQDSSGGSALAQITRAQAGSSAATAEPVRLQPAIAPQSADLVPQALASWTPAEPHLQPAVLTSPPAAFAPSVGADPSVFGSVALSVGRTALDARWMRVQYARAPSDPRWAQMVRAASELPAHERLARVNTWLNHAISFQSDLQNYGVRDYWASARETLARGRGDCEDYAIAKMELLRASGLPAANLYLLVAKDLVRHVDHALLLVRLDDGYWVLDSGTDEVLPAANVADYRPVVTFSAAGREWMHGYRRAPELVLASASHLAPASGR